MSIPGVSYSGNQAIENYHQELRSVDANNQRVLREQTAAAERDLQAEQYFAQNNVERHENFSEGYFQAIRTMVF